MVTATEIYSPSSTRPQPTAPANTAAQPQRDLTDILAEIVQGAGALAARRGEAIFLHLRAAALWQRIGMGERALTYLAELAEEHARDTFDLGAIEVRLRLGYIRYFLSLVGYDDVMLEAAGISESKHVWETLATELLPPGAPVVKNFEQRIALLSPEDEELVQELLTPNISWLEGVEVMPIAPGTRSEIERSLGAIDANADPRRAEKQLVALLDKCTQWHDRKPNLTWSHDLDDIGPRLVWLAIHFELPQVIVSYIERVVNSIRLNPLAPIDNVAFAVGGMGYLARQRREDRLFHQARKALKYLPERERCLSALSLVEALLSA